MSEISRSEKAKSYFESGYNCSQSVVLAFADLIDSDQANLARIASPFGGGMGRLREVCGAVSGMFIVTGLLLGYDEPGNDEEKKALYSIIQKLAGEFSAQTGSIICRTLKGLGDGSSDPTPEKRTEKYYQKYPCADLCRIAAEILEKELKLQGIL